jgi:hypothetical protein
MAAVADILNNRGNTPRIYRNMLAFIASDQDLMLSLEQAVRLYIAWKSIKDDSEDLNLDAAQNRETDNNLKRSNETVDARVKEAYCWLIIPYIDKNVNMSSIVWDAITIKGGNDNIVTKAAKKMLQNEAVITGWAPALLLMELDNILWREADNIPIKKLWEYLCTYCYLPRLANEDVLTKAIQAGLNSTEYFAFAAGFDGTRYIDLKINQYVGIIEKSGCLVKVSVAQKQFDEEEAKRQADAAARAAKAGIEAVVPASVGGYGISTSCTSPQPSIGDITSVHENENPNHTTETPKNTHFYMTAQLDTTRIGRDVQRLVEEVISHLTSVDGAQVEVALDVNVKSPGGLSQQVVRTVSENCRTLRVGTFGFDE